MTSTKDKGEKNKKSILELSKKFTEIIVFLAKHTRKE